MKLNKLAAAMFVAFVGFAGSNAQASNINVGGVVWDPSSIFDFSSTTNLFEVTAYQAGDTISGYGKITSVNAESNQPSFCPGCELTYTFGGYSLLDLNPADTTTGISTAGEFAFTGGWLNVYVDHTPDFNASIKSTASDGTLWLGLVGSDGGGVFGSGVTLHGNITGMSSLGLTGQGTGYFDVLSGVLGGLAQANINTNGEPGGSDLTYTSSFQPLRAPIMNGNVVVANAFGTNEIYGNSIPEPGSIALLGLGLMGLFLSRRKYNIS